MRFVKMEAECTEEVLLETLKNNQKVNEGVKFAEGEGKPFMHFKKKNKTVRMRCELMDRPTKDNGFLFGGTFFWGRISESDGETVLRGFSVTSPIYHVIILALVIYNIALSIKMGGISIIPIFAVAFEFIFFKDEFRKQGYISRYLERAFRRLS